MLSLGARNASDIATTLIRVATAMGWDLRELPDDHPNLKEEPAATAADRPSRTALGGFAGRGGIR